MYTRILTTLASHNGPPRRTLHTTIATSAHVTRPTLTAPHILMTQGVYLETPFSHVTRAASPADVDGGRHWCEDEVGELTRSVDIGDNLAIFAS